MKKTVQVVLDEKDIEKLKGDAEKQGHTLSSFMRYIIKLFLRKGKV